MQPYEDDGHETEQNTGVQTIDVANRRKLQHLARIHKKFAFDASSLLDFTFPDGLKNDAILVAAQHLSRDRVGRTSHWKDIK